MGQNRNNSLDEEDLAPTDEREAKVRGTAHRAFGVVEEAEDARVVQLGGVVLDEEVACGGVEWRGQLGTQGDLGEKRARRTVEPAEGAEDLECRLGGPEVEEDEELTEGVSWEGRCGGLGGTRTRPRVWRTS